MGSAQWRGVGECGLHCVEIGNATRGLLLVFLFRWAGVRQRPGRKNLS
jgi:hypothetical protein